MNTIIIKYHSSKITILNLVLIIMMLYRHAYYFEAENGNGIALGVQRFIDYGLCNLTNSLFFVLSGFLFFKNISSPTQCLPKIKKRIRSLLVPYVIWNCSFVVFYLMLSTLPGLGAYTSIDVLAKFTSLKDGLYYLFVTPASTPLWFLRDLMVYVAFSPLIYMCIEKLRWGFALLLFLVSPLFPVSGILEFVLGGTIAICSNLEILDKRLNNKIVATCIVIYLVNAVASIYYEYQRPIYIGNIITLTSIIAIWEGYNYLAKGRILTESKFWKPIVGYSFFIYLSHIPALNIIKKIPIVIFGTSEINIIVWYLLSPLVFVAIAIPVAKSMQRFVPSLYSLLVGGR